MHLTLTATSEDRNARIDAWLAARVEGLTRSAAAKLLESGDVLVNGAPAAKNYRLTGDADARRRVFRNAGGVFAQPAEQDQRNGRDHAQKRGQRQPWRGGAAQFQIARGLLHAHAAALRLLGKAGRRLLLFQFIL